METFRPENLEAIKKLGYAVNVNLPLLDEGMSVVRETEQVANRINILHLLYTTSIEGDKSIPFFFRLIKKNDWTRHLTQDELRYFEAGKLPYARKAKYSWYKEAITALLWATDLVKNLRDFNETDMAVLYPIIPPEADETEFLDSLKFRSQNELLRELDFFYLLRSSVKHDARQSTKFFGLFKRSVPELPLIIERSRALEWLFTTHDWDDVSLDT
jgi:hypothetical protein